MDLEFFLTMSATTQLFSTRLANITNPGWLTAFRADQLYIRGMERRDKLHNLPFFPFPPRTNIFLQLIYTLNHDTAGRRQNLEDFASLAAIFPRQDFYGVSLMDSHNL
jgi:hypothetical protein